jgi:nucleoside-diphosphate-sugar epimerase
MQRHVAHYSKITGRAQAAKISLPSSLLQETCCREMLLASYTRAYGMRTYVTRPAAICPPERRRQMPHHATLATGWNPWLWAWVGSEDVASAHRLLMEEAEHLPLHDVYYLTADDTTALEPSAELIAQFQPALLPFAEGFNGHQSFFSTRKLQQAVGWQHHTSWRSPVQ